MARRFVMLGVVVAALIAVAPSAEADGWHGGHGCCWHGGSRVFFGFNFGPPLYAPYPYYYPPPAVYYAPPPVYYAPPVYAEPAPTPANPGQTAEQGCREYTSKVTVDGRLVQSHGTACPRPDGSWQLMN